MDNRELQASPPAMISLLVLVFILITSYISPAYSADRDTLVVGQSADITSFDPTEMRMGTLVLTNLLYNNLIRLDSNGHPQPELASSWQRTGDGKTLTLHLREGIRFHNGKTLTAKDVAFSIDYAKNPGNGANILPLARLVERVETPDMQTVVLHLNGGSDSIFDLLDLLFIVDSDAADQIKTSGNGTGPFKLARYEPGQEAVFVRNDNYWRTPASLRRVIIRIIPDQQAQILQLRTGSLDFIPSVDQQNVGELKAAGLSVDTASAESRVLDLTLNNRTAPLNNSSVRRAIRLALDRTRIAKDVAGPTSLVKCLPWPDHVQINRSETVEACEHDITLAKKLIADAGAQGAQVNIMSRSQSEPQIGAMSQIVQNELTEIGLKPSINEMSEAAYISRFRKGDFQIAAHVFGRASRSPATILSSAVIFKAKDNLAGLISEQYQQDVSQVTTAPLNDDSERALQRINALLLHENWVISVATLPMLWASRQGVTDLRFTSDGLPLLEYARISP
ncbi:ABC transporter substrate-binding protein (plasmid) [Rahnella aquatilis]|uniref:ABC transporter substrate-binding protein n=1 Tax=Rahnella perminowiae TaxID=2816244 RepID=A0ABS6KWD9_9GAMM|nr:ABC transporter substrate-binding protein [Rahnella perminowiae]MBU9833582.1 ABC transporter substrate-binding protein [Rahnella perminowiae]UJD92358.1 ABC transporter substrate-binding protein [Rahnella aquatilis]